MSKKILNPTGITIAHIFLGAFALVVAESNSAVASKCYCCTDSDLPESQAKFLQHTEDYTKCPEICSKLGNLAKCKQK